MTFDVFAYLAKDDSLRALTIVTLEDGQSPVSGPRAVGGQEHLQETDAEHGQDLNLFAQRQREPSKFRQWQNDDRQIQDKVQGSGHPSLHIDVVACSLECLVPREPRTRYRPALKDGNDLKDDQVGYVEADESPDSDFYFALGKDLEIEQEDGDLRDGKDTQIDELVPEVQLFFLVSLEPLQPS